MKTRKIVSLLLLFAFIITSYTGIILYIAPSGRIATDTNWSFFNNTRDDAIRMHTIWGYIMIILSIFHLILNWRSIINYIHKKGKAFISKEMIIVLIILIILFITIKKNIPPFKNIMDYRYSLKRSNALYKNNNQKNKTIKEGDGYRWGQNRG